MFRKFWFASSLGDAQRGIKNGAVCVNGAAVAEEHVSAEEHVILGEGTWVR
jgi:hypothetical protein